MDVITALEIADKLGGAGKDISKYDEIVLTHSHVDRLTADSKTSDCGSFMGLKIIANDVVPDGYGVLRQGGKVVGILDFVTKQTIMLNQSANRQHG